MLEYFDNLENSDRSEYSHDIFVETPVHFFTFWEKVNSLFSLILKIHPHPGMQIPFQLDVIQECFYTKYLS